MNYEKEIAIMQNNLRDIRKFLHISGQRLGEMLGVTKQYISCIELGKAKLTKTQYLAIMYVLTTEIIPDIDDMQREYLNKLLTCKVKEKRNISYIDTLIFEEEVL